MKTIQLKSSAILVAATLALSVGCNKETDQQSLNSNPPNATNLGSLTIDQKFNWSSSLKGNLEVSITTEDNLYTEGEPVQIVTKHGNVIDQTVVKNGVASFYIHLPQSAEAYLYYPNTGDSKLITGTGKANLELTSVEEVLTGNTKSSIISKKSAAATGVNLLGNSDFSNSSDVVTDPSFSSGSPSLIDGKWRVNSSSYSLTGDQLNFTAYTFWGQTINVVGGSTFALSSTWQIPNTRIVISFFNNNDDFIGYAYPSTFGFVVGGQHTGTIPGSATKALIWSSSRDGSYVDDVEFSSSPTIADADNDGVADNLDQFPNDPLRAYQSSFPTIGNQFLAFEDLWPSKGDFDFNDMVVKNKVVYTKNASNYLVDATFTIDLNAVGAGMYNGLGVVLLNNNKQPLSSDVINAISGNASANASLTNGIIVFDDAFAAQSTYYTNTGSGPSGTPEQFQFTVTFAPNTVSSIIPDLYIFRRDDHSHEVHLDGFSGTALANVNLMNTVDDYNGTYNTENGLPWAVEIITPDGTTFRHPLEKVDILVAYPLFQVWAESNGAANTLWFASPLGSEVY